ncbi:heterokaryon incompatibility protein-domain-containing protein [Massariosphaeria phaeospora]|uniref:Heterokaryon incompatibility protein-domain-containing protein n=1 Tax=Massariosphaeria phaeospora TaxID=100035 RepID=A0A7C8IJG1_9PLEO|nr:heterokaryon incompatibility protein-domain-containing protein [Massariosphaeria phaeospora]
MGVPKVVVNDELSSATPAIPASGFLSGRPYSYRKQLGPSEIRLIRILPATTTMIRCKVITLRLSELEPYIAISYAWGDSGDKHEIELDGVETRITSSLHGALKALRRRKSPVLVWADYISINQDDNEEKKWQVQRMADIYAQAESVAIWLGPESDESHLAMHLLGTVADYEDSPNDVADIIKSLQWEDCIEATVSLFERDYWKRLWVVQEVFNAQKKQVYCGPSIIDWSVFEVASNAFDRQRYHLDRHYSGGTRSGNRYNVSSDGRTYSEVLANQGPRTFTDLKSISPIGKKSLLEALLRCRTKLSANPRDKVYGLLGIMTREVQEHFPPDYNISVKKLYTNIVDFIVRTTERLDVLREAIYFPLCTNTNNLPTWVPDWSHIPQVAGLNASFGFSASGSTKAKFNFIVNNGVTNKIEIDAIEIDKIHSHGIAVGTLCAMADYFMAFLHWRALLLEYLDKCGIAGQDHARAQDTFCRTLCLDHVPRTWKDPKQWTAVCYHVFASLITERLRYIPLDSELRHYATTDVGVESDARRRVLYQNCGRRMQGRCFCITQRGFMGLGTGFMGVEDIVVVPLGCSTPLILRPEGKEYRIVGDVYIDGYMQGEAVAMRDAGKLEQKTYTLH